MTSAQTFTPANDDRRSASVLVSIAVVTLALLVAFGLVVYLNVTPSTPVAPITKTARPAVAARDQACAAALERARDSRRLSSQDAIAASTAMLRACDVH